jgi:DNA-binding XRE family transcriptional regulator
MNPNQLPNPQEALARQRAALIVAVQSGQITASEAAQQLGISRKTYYQWEKRALAALVEAMRDRPGGRPATPTNPAQKTLHQQTQQLQEQIQVLEQTLAIRQQLAELERTKKNS